MNETFEPLDALRNPIKIGARYGYSSTSSGWSKTAIGTAGKINKSGTVTISIEKVNHFLYGKPIEKDWGDSKTVSIRPHMLFPVGDVNG